MQCQQCRFENMSNRDRCGRCGALLEWSGPRSPKAFTPPRARHSLNERLRTRLSYHLNRLSSDWLPAPDNPARIVWNRRSDNLIAILIHPWKVLDPMAAFLSVVPGLGHFYVRRFAAGVVFLGIWLALGGVLVNAWVGYLGAGLVLALGVAHTLAAVSASGLFDPRHENENWRIMAFSQVLMVALLSYSFGNWVATRIWIVVQIPDPIPLVGALRDDAFLARHGTRPDWLRGDWAFFHLVPDEERPPDPVEGRALALRWPEYVPALVAGLPGDHVRANAKGLWINDVPAPEAWRPEDWQFLPGTLNMVLEPERYFVIVQQPIRQRAATILRIQQGGLASHRNLTPITKLYWTWARRQTLPRGEWTPPPPPAEATTPEEPAP